MSLVTFAGQGQVTYYWGTQCSSLTPSQLHTEHRQLLQPSVTLTGHRLSLQLVHSSETMYSNSPAFFRGWIIFWTKHSRSFCKNLSFHLQLSLPWSYPRLPQSQDSGILLVLEMVVTPQITWGSFRLTGTQANVNKVWKVPAVVPFTVSQIWPVSLQLSFLPL